MKRCRLKRYNFQIMNKMNKENKTLGKPQNGNDFIADVRQRLFVGDKIRDIEDGDCYYEGIVMQTNPLKYKITNIVWCDEEDDSMNGQILELKWWLLEKLIDGKWIRLNVA